MERKKKYVLGAGGAILRFFLMIPGVILILIGGIGILTAGGAGEIREEAIAEIRSSYQAQGIDSVIVEDIIEDGTYLGDGRSLTDTERQAIYDLEAEMIDVNLESLVGGGATVVAGGMSIAALVGGLFFAALGFLIGIRKWKLICNQCGTAINAA
jgi:hypothetical protein